MPVTSVLAYYRLNPTLKVEFLLGFTRVDSSLSHKYSTRFVVVSSKIFIGFYYKVLTMAKFFLYYMTLRRASLKYDNT
jgi:hypothetical protein